MRYLSLRQTLSTVETFLSSNASGHYGVCCPAGSDLSVVSSDSFFRLRSLCRKGSREANLLLVHCRTDGSRRVLDISDGQTDSPEGAPSSPLSVALDSCESFFAGVPRPAIIVVYNFELLTVDEQCEVLGCARSARTSSTEPLHVFVIGAWRPQQFFQHWQTTREDRSPPLDQGKVIYAGGPVLDDLEERLKGRLQGSADSVQVALELLLDHTGGDVRLLRYVEDEMRAGEPSRPSVLETLVFRMAERADVRDLVLREMEGISARAARLVESLLRHQAILLSRDDLDAEDLMVRGILRLAPGSTANSRTIRWQVSSPIVGQVLRRSWSQISQGGRRFWHETDVLPLHHIVNLRAMVLIAEIESLLRNVVTLQLETRSVGEEPLSLASSSSDTARGAFRDALALRKADLEDPDINLLRVPLTSFLEPMQLRDILLDQELYAPFFRRYFEQKELLVAKFKEFNSVRKAVAHGKLLSCDSLDRLEATRNWFQDCLAKAAAREMKEAELVDQLRVGRRERRLVALEREGKQKLIAEVVNVGGSPVGGAVFEARAPGGECSERTPETYFAPGDRRALHFLLPAQAKLDVSRLEIHIVLAGVTVPLQPESNS